MKCEYCDFENEINEEKCVKCGATLNKSIKTDENNIVSDVNHNSPNNLKNDKGKNPLVILGIIILVIVVVGIIVIRVVVTNAMKNYKHFDNADNINETNESNASEEEIDDSFSWDEEETNDSSSLDEKETDDADIDGIYLDNFELDDSYIPNYKKGNTKKNTTYVDNNYFKNKLKIKTIKDDYISISNESIKIPYLNINSDSAKKLNKKFEELFEEKVKKFNEYEKNYKNIEDEVKEYWEEEISSDYEYYISNDILSLIFWPKRYNWLNLETEYGVEVYNFDIKTGKLLADREILEKFNMDYYKVENTILALYKKHYIKIKNSNKNYMDFYEFYGNIKIDVDEDKLDSFFLKEMKKYLNAKRYRIFVNDHGDLSAIIHFSYNSGVDDGLPVYFIISK